MFKILVNTMWAKCLHNGSIGNIVVTELEFNTAEDALRAADKINDNEENIAMDANAFNGSITQTAIPLF